jgi:AraC-like DNA-binding protein
LKRAISRFCIVGLDIDAILPEIRLARWLMTSCGTTTHTDPDEYRANVPGVAVDLVLTSSDAFKARVAWIKLRRLTLVTVEEVAPHIALLSLDPSRVFVSFPLHGEPVWDGIRVRRGDFVMHRTGDRLHHLAQSSIRWGLISILPNDLAACGRTLADKYLTPPETTRLLRPAWKTTAEMLRLHTRACRVAATRPEMMAHREVARSVELELTFTLIDILANSKAHDRRALDQRRADIMLRFADTLAAQPNQQRLSSLCATIGVQERVLRVCCQVLLARTPLKYIRIRQLNQVRSAISKSNHETATVAGIAKSHGFLELGRFAGHYRALFGETPSATLSRSLSNLHSRRRRRHSKMGLAW